ncbi:hypothetical protein [Oceanidesulfovibrio marinus]|uniref:Uncharacterized protein n=1 Tax=Oceanidesulfovibrio marinus TaxID=370038 RepID=A0A6P1ZBF4_9BACT|nr:hypothetical protein [Oceanidesulfovibrio marinus]TVM30816.1 hypothetical protein DQK91_19765 [Oceanidesulfovibrio marinus]
MSAAPEFITATLARLPGLTAALTQCGEKTLAEYSRDFFPEPTASAIEPLDDFLDAAERIAAPLLGQDVACALREQLERSPSALTANHHGLDTLHQSVHSTIAFALPALLGRSDGPRVLPVLACSGVPLGSVTFPRGMVLAKKPDLLDDANPAKVRIPFFPHALRTCAAGAAPALNKERFNTALKYCERLMRESMLTHSQYGFLRDFITQECLRKDVLAQPTFSDQAVLLNSRLWPRLFAPEVRGQAPALAYLDMERVVAAVLARDLRRDSLVAALLFDPGVRESLLHALDGATGCWSGERLERLCTMPEGRTIQHGDLRGTGTMFFWAVDAGGRHLPMRIEDGSAKPGAPVLAARTMDGGRIEVALAAEPILHALAEGRISPSLFTSYTTLAMARGVRCWGGVYQAAYLREMQRGVAQALRMSGGDDAASRVSEAPCGCFLAGLITVFSEFPDKEPRGELREVPSAKPGNEPRDEKPGDEPRDEKPRDEPRAGYIAPACAPDIAAAGGLTAAQIEQISHLTMAQACTAGLLQTYEEITSASERKKGWYGEMCLYMLEECGEGLPRVEQMD